MKKVQIYNNCVEALKRNGFKINYFNNEESVRLYRCPVYGEINGNNIEINEDFDVDVKFETLTRLVSNYYFANKNGKKLWATVSEYAGQLFLMPKRESWSMKAGEKQYEVEAVIAMYNLPAIKKGAEIVKSCKAPFEKKNLAEVNNPIGIDSRDVARMIGKRHDHLIRDIKNYAQTLENSNAPKFGLVDFFIESTYKDSKGETRPCYILTRKGCEFVANKMTGEKGILFTAAYINKFHEMEQGINTNIKSIPTNIIKDDKTSEINAKIKLSNQLLKLSKDNMLSSELKNSLVLKASEVLKEIVEVNPNE